MSSKTTHILSLGLQTKLKIIVSFYQIVSSLETVYGIKVDDKLKELFDFFHYFSFDMFWLVSIPKSCMGSMRLQLILSSIWPYIMIGCVAIGMIIFRYKKIKPYSRSLFPNLMSIKQSATHVKSKILHMIVFILYFSLPMVSQSIFEAKKCRAFKVQDSSPPGYLSFLLADMNIMCDDQRNREFFSLQPIFWVAFTVWMVLTPLMFLVLLIRVKRSVQEGSPTRLALACRFLWEDYSNSAIFWDVIDTIRKLCLTGFIMFIDPQEGSNKTIRLSVAAIISVFYLGMLAASRPYKRLDDLYIAIASNICLACSFVAGITLHLCGDNINESGRPSGSDGICAASVGLSLDSYKASIILVFLSIAMLAICNGLVAHFYRNSTDQGTSRSSCEHGVPPKPRNNVWVQISFVRKSRMGYAIVQKLELLLPRLVVWLDVDNLYNMDKLGMSVME